MFPFFALLMLIVNFRPPLPLLHLRPAWRGHLEPAHRLARVRFLLTTDLSRTCPGAIPFRRASEMKLLSS
ncbi:hypothetical protein HPP92_008359 [Vanilla planifolia]|uniref:Secreted protein n=1 Tax=Vanilla planifolia TaxID=51239 RepID=A0A835R2I3_VANPL|nr:hypothetical protein HPP92_008359 [Vanilla planifolia]